MVQFKAFSASAEVSGGMVSHMVDAMGVYRPVALAILAENGISEPQPGKWYPQQAWLDSVRMIADRMGDATLFLIGQQVPENEAFPKAIDSIDTALRAIDVAYHINHRVAGQVLFDTSTGKTRDGIGHYTLLGVDGDNARMKCTNPLPCEFDRGLIEAVAERFRPSRSLWFRVAHDDSGSCRKQGADSCAYLIQW